MNGFGYGKVLQLYQQVKIPLDRLSKEQFEEARFEFHQELQEDFFSAYKVETLNIYRVKNGDNIWTLCNDLFKVPMWLVKKYNPEVDFNDLRWSQKLAIPVVEKLDESPYTFSNWDTRSRNSVTRATVDSTSVFDTSPDGA